MTEKIKKPQGFAAISPERRKEIASLGGKSVPSEKRAFTTKKGLAAKAGSKGGKAPRTVKKKAKPQE